MNPSDHIFSKRPTRAKTIEKIVFWLFRIATYTVVAAATFIFADICVKGAIAVADRGPSFFVDAPQTLHVFEPKTIVHDLESLNTKILSLEAEQRALGSDDSEREAAITQELKSLSKEKYTLNQKRIAERKMYNESEMQVLAKEGALPSNEIYDHQTYAYSGGGIGPPIVGTVLLVVGSVTIALILGVFCAIYLSEYSKPGVGLQTVRLSILNLSGVPSIVFGLFGFGMFVLFFDWGVSMIAGWFTLAFMALPLIIAASEESMKAIPKGFREGSLALGATKWTTIRTNVLPYAMPGILTSSIMGIARVAGETAPIMFTAAYALRDQLPWEGLDHWWDFFFQGVMALPYHIYVVSAKIPQNEYTQSMQYGAAFVFLVIVGSLALSSIVLRVRVRGKFRW